MALPKGSRDRDLIYVLLVLGGLYWLYQRNQPWWMDPKYRQPRDWDEIEDRQDRW